ncbi:ribulose-phosphate 3-epimerase [Patescibacteria group bacterium]|nr:ribulose-phosphate 3-epimerase [Patescibacteria group bacterium]MBU1029149.1 ribulose-phosphate 3-epimerase [Patescibacteria group bacterium]MBU1916393.1 ribulose-phosphate 3-epimerase [Patescibacteria group bacterium]
MELCPAILAQNESEFKKKVEWVRSLGLRVHVDAMDGIFVTEKTWAEPSRMKQIMNSLQFNVHLMVANPKQAIPVWLMSGADKIYFHYESTQHHQLVIQVIEDGKRLGLVINPETPVDKIDQLLDLIGSVLIMSVTPGRGGQKFNEVALEKIQNIRHRHPQLHIAVDGGIKPENIASLAAAGANTAIIGSALTEATDPKAAQREFQLQLRKIE